MGSATSGLRPTITKQQVLADVTRVLELTKSDKWPQGDTR
jgi:hypothetical protein